ncbi:contact-dependent growth inhibition system immunity protein [Streptomyces clavifer]|uniref:contact-dependent growth inhibition system immunity protein n=1 Tax=Streptomyces clavifer TaxID=68188 RepID=UPI003660F512
MPDEFEDHEAALQDHADSTDPGLVAQLAGELRELLALPAEELDYITGPAELGLEVEPPVPLSTVGWLVEPARAVDRHRPGGRGS